MPTSAKSFLRIVWNGRRDERKGKGARVAGMLKKEDQRWNVKKKKKKKILSINPIYPLTSSLGLHPQYHQCHNYPSLYTFECSTTAAIVR